VTDELPTDLSELADRYAMPDQCVRANMVLSLDGASAVDGKVRPLSSPEDLALLRLLRALSDVVLVGAGTVRAEGYARFLLDPHLTALRARLGLPGHPALAIVTGSLDLRPEAPVFAEPSVTPLLITTAAAAARRTTQGWNAELVVAGDDRLEVTEVLDMLRARGAGRVLCEGGPQLLSQLVAADLLDELCLTLSPRLVGPQPTAGGGRTATRNMALAHQLSHDDFLFLRYVRH
jgi:riboflavin biosynthesis pyrimidine reductase